MSASRIIPNWEEISRFRQPLTQGERSLITTLDDHLPQGWEIYVQPYLNGDRPDIVLLHPRVGLCVIEVKDWKPSAYRSFETGSIIKGQRVIKRQFQVYTQSSWQNIASPLAQTRRYVDNLLSLYEPGLGEAVDENKSSFAIYRSGIYFHRMSTEEAQHLACPRENDIRVVGGDFMKTKDLGALVPDCNFTRSKWVEKGWAARIRTHLRPPFHAIEQGLPLRLTPEQKRHAEPAPGVHQRLRGVAGSGKTLVLAQRAAALAEDGQKVLVVYFNITLGAYIRDHVSRARRGFGWDRVEFRHFHHLCKTFLSENSVEWPKGQGQSVMREEVPRMVSTLLAGGRNIKNRAYDAILIDEGQDFNRYYYQTLCGFLSKRDELLLVRDERQNIYDEDGTWTEADPKAEIKTRFRGQWRVLSDSFRMPQSLIPLAQDYAERFLEDGPQEIRKAIDPQLELELGAPHLIWRECEGKEDTLLTVDRGVQWLIHTKKVHQQDIVILTATHHEGEAIVERLENKHKMRVNHVFGDEEDSRHHKRAFQMNDGRIKVSTVHSFKGWELVNVLLLIPDDAEYRKAVRGRVDMDRLVYTAITRTRNNLIVYNRNTRYSEYGELWPHSWKVILENQ